MMSICPKLLLSSIVEVGINMMAITTVKIFLPYVYRAIAIVLLLKVTISLALKFG